MRTLVLIALSSSLVLPICAVFGVLGFSSGPLPVALLLCLIVSGYIGPIYFLDRVERYYPSTRKRIWTISLVIHAPIFMFGVIAAIVWSWGALILVAPELIAAVLLVRGIGLHAKGTQVA